MEKKPKPSLREKGANPVQWALDSRQCPLRPVVHYPLGLHGGMDLEEWFAGTENLKRGVCD